MEPLLRICRQKLAELPKPYSHSNWYRIWGQATGLVTEALAVVSVATFWLLPISPFVAMAAVVRTKHSVGWPRRLSIAAAAFCSAYTLAVALLTYCVTIYILTGGLEQ
jgi:hypothetical protein